MTNVPTAALTLLMMILAETFHLCPDHHPSIESVLAEARWRSRAYVGAQIDQSLSSMADQATWAALCLCAGDCPSCAEVEEICR